MSSVLSQPHTASVLCYTRPWESWAIKVSVFPVSLLSQHDGWWRLFLLPSTGSPFNWIRNGPLGFDQRGHWPCLCLNYFSASSLAVACLMKTGPRQDSLRASRIDLAWRLCLTVWLSLENRGLMRQRERERKKKCLLALQLTWFQIPPLLLPWKCVAYVQ